MYFFMFYQKNLKLDVLQIRRSKYQQLERKFFRYFKIATASTIAVYSAYIAVNWYLYFKMT